MKISTSNATRDSITLSVPHTRFSIPFSDSTEGRRKEIDREVEALWTSLFVKVRGSVSCKLVEAIVLSASSAISKDSAPVTLPSVQADFDWTAFQEYVGNWIIGGDSVEDMITSFKHFRAHFTTQVCWEFEVASDKYESFDPRASVDLERQYIEGVGECVLEMVDGSIHEIDLDDRIMYGDKSKVKLRRRVDVVKVPEVARAGGHSGLFYAEDSNITDGPTMFVRDLPTANTVVSWNYRTHNALWQHFNRFQSFSLEKAYRESRCADVFTCDVGGELHTIVTVDTEVPVMQHSVNGVDYINVRRGPHIMRKADYIPDQSQNSSTDSKCTNNRFSLIRRIIVPRDRAHHSDVLWRGDCHVVYAAQAIHEKRPAMARAFRELEAKGVVSLVPDSLDDDDLSLFLLAKELIDVWAVPPISIAVPNLQSHYEVLVEGMFVPLIPINSWIMHPGTKITPCREDVTTGPITSSAGEPCEKIVFLFKQWLKYNPSTCTILLPSSTNTSISLSNSQQYRTDTLKDKIILWCRLAHEKDSVVRFILNSNTPWICDREFVSLHSTMPRKFLEANVCMECPDIRVEEANVAMAWALRGFKGKLQDYGVIDVEAVRRAVEFLGFDKAFAAATSGNVPSKIKS
eukprot:Tbor_TRINITY_DN5796_c0_g2::TRINITY_DN5796_c0_g2_i1::g.20396::m.20396